jgi:predicted acetyltransferase
MKNLQDTIENVSLIVNKENFKYNAFKEVELSFKTYRQAIHNTKMAEFIKLVDSQFEDWLDSTEIQDKLIAGIRSIIK